MAWLPPAQRFPVARLLCDELEFTGLATLATVIGFAAIGLTGKRSQLRRPPNSERRAMIALECPNRAPKIGFAILLVPTTLVRTTLVRWLRPPVTTGDLLLLAAGFGVTIAIWATG